VRKKLANFLKRLYFGGDSKYILNQKCNLWRKCLSGKQCY
jgi:hypothetical protein